MRKSESAWTAELLQSPHTAPDKASRVRRMFNAIAPRYEFVNSLFSVGCDRSWRRRAVQLARVRTEDRVLDIACGTGDFARSFARAGIPLVVGSDFAHEMLRRATGRDRGTSRWCEADAARLPFRSRSFTIVSCAFGVRNFDDLDHALGEVYRVLDTGGRAVILEFSRPRGGLTRWLSELYATRLMPWAAALVSGDRSGAYRYLPRSVLSFLDADQMCATLQRAGFARVKALPLTMGVVTVYIATRDG